MNIDFHGNWLNYIYRISIISTASNILVELYHLDVYLF